MRCSHGQHPMQQCGQDIHMVAVSRVMDGGLSAHACSCASVVMMASSLLHNINIKWLIEPIKSDY